MGSRFGERGTNVGLGLCLAAVVVLLSLPSFDDPGPEMDEGTLVAYPSLVAEGMVPGRDFETFYGPAQPYLLAGASAILGHGIGVERVSGLLFVLVITLSLFIVALPYGRRLALGGGVAAALALHGLGLAGLAILGGLASTLAGLALLAGGRAPDRRVAEPDRLAAVAAGLIGALALSFRPDLAPAVLLSAAPLLLWTSTGRVLGRAGLLYIGALIVGLVPLLVWLAAIGPDGIERLLEDLSASRPGRRLPLPEVASVEFGLLALAAAVTVGALVAAVLALRADRNRQASRLLLGAALLLAALAPSALQRADSAHVAPFAAVAAGLAPIVGSELLKLLPRSFGRVVAGLGAAVVLVAVGHAAAASFRDPERSFSGSGSEVSRGDRTFPIRSEAAARDLGAILASLDSATSDGDRLFVGPVDLSRTAYADTFIYYLFPELAPASFYTELNPGTANAEGSTLAGELAAADALLLTDRHAPDTEAASRPGSVAAPDLVDSSFCVERRAGTYELLTPC